MTLDEIVTQFENIHSQTKSLRLAVSQVKEHCDSIDIVSNIDHSFSITFVLGDASRTLKIPYSR